MSKRVNPALKGIVGSFLPFQKFITSISGYKYYLASLGIMLLSWQFVSAQVTNPVQGKVMTGDTSLPNVTVQVKGFKTATQTDRDGNFSIQAAPNATLVVTAIGYGDVEVKVNNRKTITVQMESAAKQLDQVVVVGYGTQKRKDLTGAVSSVSAEQIAKVPVTTIDQALQGRSAGVSVTNNDGAPGAGVQVQIRGVGSLGSNDPLYVVDGYPITGGLGNINPSDIASIDVLKDASATAIYGNRAANGVVIITTKRGNKNGVQISLDELTSVQSKPKTYDVLNAQQWATLANELAPANGFLVLPEWSNPAALTNVDWQDALYRTGLKQNYNLAIRGGNDKVQSAFSAGYFDQKGIVLGSKFNRINLSLNLDYTPTSWLKSTSSVKYSRNNSNVRLGSGTGSVGRLSELIPTITGNKLTNQIKDDKGNYGFYNPINVNTRSWNNPVYDIESQDSKNLSNYLLASTSLEVTIFSGLKVKTNLGINTSDYSGYYFTPSDTRALTQYGLGTQTSKNYYSQNANNTFEWLWENTLSYTKTFGVHSIDFVGGVSAQENTYRQIGANGSDLPSDVLRDLSSITTGLKVSGNQTTYSLASEFARLNYKLMDKYLLTATVRRDGSSRFAPDHQYGVFPSGSIAWKAKEESFLKNVDFITDLKFRGSYGQTGNQANAGLFQYLGQYGSGGPANSTANVGYPFNKVYQPGLVLTSLPNPGLKWETTDQTDIGMDAAFLNGALTLTFDYYKKKSKDFLLQIPIPVQTGFATASRNVGSISNEGIEVAVNYRKSAGGITYNIGLNITTVTNKLLSLTNGLNFVNNLINLPFSNTGANTWVTFSQTNIGGPVGEFFGYKSAGIFQTQAEINALNAQAVSRYGAGAVYQAGAAPGDRKFIDKDGSGQVTAVDQYSLGSPIPKLYGGLNFDATYKAFDLNLFFYGSFGNKIFNYQAKTLESFQSQSGAVGIQNVSVNYYQNRWTTKNPSNRYARAVSNDVNGNGRPSDVYIEDGSYVRLRNVQLGYTLPAAFAKRAYLNGARIYVAVQNLFTITKYNGLDPEIGLQASSTGSTNVTASGVDLGTYPLSKFYSFGLNVTF